MNKSHNIKKNRRKALFTTLICGAVSLITVGTGLSVVKAFAEDGNIDVGGDGFVNNPWGVDGGGLPYLTTFESNTSVLELNPKKGTLAAQNGLRGVKGADTNQMVAYETEGAGVNIAAYSDSLPSGSVDGKGLKLTTGTNNQGVMRIEFRQTKGGMDTPCYATVKESDEMTIKAYFSVDEDTTSESDLKGDYYLLADRTEIEYHYLYEFEVNCNEQNQWLEITLTGSDLLKLADEDGKLGALYFYYDTLTPTTKPANGGTIYFDEIVYTSNDVNTDELGEKIQVTDGASIRINSAEDSGIRFETKFSKSYVDGLAAAKAAGTYTEVTYGTLIVPKTYLERGYTITHAGLEGETLLDIVADGETTFVPNMTDADWYYMRASITSMRNANYYEGFFAVSYVKTVSSSGAIGYTYSKINEDNVRSIYDVAKAAYTDRTSSQSTNYKYDTGATGAYRYSQFDTNKLDNIRNYLDAVAVYEKSGSSVAYAGGIDSAIYTPAYSVSVNSSTGDATVTSSKSLAKVVYNGASVATVDSGTQATFGYWSGDRREVGTVNSLSFDVIGGSDVMPIGGFHGPNDQYITEENFKLFKEAGINFFGYPFDMYEAEADTPGVEKALKLSEKYGMGYFMVLGNAMGAAGGNGTLDERLLKSSVEKVSSYKSFVGLHLMDEPYIPQMTTNATVANAFNSLGLVNKYTYGNLLPYLDIDYDGDGKADGGNATTYKNYVNNYISTVQPKFLSWDRYPFELKKKTSWGSTTYSSVLGDAAGYFENLSIIKECADAAGIPYWGFVQAGGDWNDSNGSKEIVSTKVCTESQFRWNVATQLAYGVKGIQYFTLIQPESFAYGPNGASGEQDYGRNGLIGANGQINQWYNYAKEAGQHIQVIDSVLMNATHEGIMVGNSSSYGRNIPSADKKTSYHELTAASQGMVGLFNYKGRTALYVVNDNFDSAKSITLTFNGNYGYQMVQGASATRGRTSSNKITLSNLKAGEGVLIVLD